MADPTFDQLWDSVPAPSAQASSAPTPMTFDQAWDAAPAPGGSSDRLDILGNFVQGVKDTPAALWGLAKSIPGGLENVYESVRRPIDSIENGTTEKTLRGVGQGALATAGTLVGGPVGGAAGANLFDKLLQLVGVDAETTGEHDLNQIAHNTGALLATGVAADAAAKPVGWAGNKLEGYASKAQQEALGANANSFAASARRDGVIKFDEVQNPNGTVTKVPLDAPTTKLHQALEGVANEGLIGPTTTAADLSINIGSKLDDLNSQVRSVIDQVDTMRQAQGIKIYPQLTEAENYINTRAPVVDRPALRKELQNWNTLLRSEGDGSLGFLQTQKVELGQRTYAAGKKSAEAFDAAVTSDLRRTIEDVTNTALGKQQAGVVADLNGRIGNLLEVQKIPDLAAIRDANKSTSGVLHNLSATTGGAVGQGLIGLGIGGPIGAVIGLGTGLATRYLQTPGGKVLQSAALTPLGKALRSVAGVLPEVTSGAAIATRESQIQKRPLAAALESQPQKTAPSIQVDATSPALKNQILSPSPDTRPIPDATQAPLAQKISTVVSPTSKDLPTLMNVVLGKKAIEQIGQSGSKADQAALEMSVRDYMKKGMSESDAKRETISDVQSGKLNLDVTQAVQEIKADPYYNALATAESGWNPNAKNKSSSATGLFQLVSGTAKSLGVEDPKNITQSFEGVKKLTEENKAIFGSDPAMLYAAHYLGANVLKKWLDGKPLTDVQQAQVLELKTKALPNFLKAYRAATGMVSA